MYLSDSRLLIGEDEAGLSRIRRTTPNTGARAWLNCKPHPPAPAQAKSCLTWVDNRFPLSKLYNEHMSRVLRAEELQHLVRLRLAARLLVLVMQILDRHLPDDALQARRRHRRSRRSRYIMRDVPWGWLVRYMHSTGASAFFIVVYLHMFRGLIYGSYRKPRELVWLFGCGIFLCLMAEAFMGYLLPWGQMSYWGAQVIVNLFAGGALHRPRPGAADPRRLRRRRRDAEPLLQLPRDRRAAGAARPGGAHIIALHEVGSNNPDGVEIRPTRTPRRAIPLDGIPFHPYYTVHDIYRRRGVPVHLQRGRVLRARGRRLLPRVQQLHRGQSAEDAGAHRAGLVLHAVLLDAAGDDRPHGLRPDGGGRGRRRARHSSRRLRLGQPRSRSPSSPSSRWPCSRPSTPSSGASSSWARAVHRSCSSCPGSTAARSSRSATGPDWHKYLSRRCSSSSSSALGYLGSQPPSAGGNCISQIGTLVYFGFFLLHAVVEPHRHLQAGARARDLHRPLSRPRAQR